MSTTTKSEVRYCEGLGMFAIDRPIAGSCLHQTSFCESHCYNDKLYRNYPAMHGKDQRNEAYWQQITGEQVRATLKGKRRQTARVRLMTRGEAVRDHSDFARLVDICMANPETLFWMPTRAWRNSVLRLRVERELMGVPNLRILASMDPTNTPEEWESLKVAGWSTMYFGDDGFLTTPNGDRMFKCPKTWGHVNGACASCKRGCFQEHGRVDVHLKQH